MGHPAAAARVALVRRDLQASCPRFRGAGGRNVIPNVAREEFALWSSSAIRPTSIAPAPPPQTAAGDRRVNRSRCFPSPYHSRLCDDAREAGYIRRQLPSRKLSATASRGRRRMLTTPRHRTRHGARSYWRRSENQALAMHQRPRCLTQHAVGDTVRVLWSPRPCSYVPDPSADHETWRAVLTSPVEEQSIVKPSDASCFDDARARVRRSALSGWLQSAESDPLLGNDEALFHTSRKNSRAQGTTAAPPPTIEGPRCHPNTLDDQDPIGRSEARLFRLTFCLPALASAVVA